MIMHSYVLLCVHVRARCACSPMCCTWAWVSDSVCSVTSRHFCTYYRSQVWIYLEIVFVVVVFAFRSYRLHRNTNCEVKEKDWAKLTYEQQNHERNENWKKKTTEEYLRSLSMEKKNSNTFLLLLLPINETHYSHTIQAIFVISIVNVSNIWLLHIPLRVLSVHTSHTCYGRRHTYAMGYS